MRYGLYVGLSAILLTVLLLTPSVSFAASPSPRILNTLSASPTATSATSSSLTSDTATDSTIASAAANLEPIIQAKQEKDITQTTPQQKNKLVEILDQNPVGPLSWYNFLQVGIRRAVVNGLPANIIVLILLFPLITAIISFSRHVIGLKGFGVYTPAVLSVAFVSTGILNGIVMFLIILAAAMIMKKILRRLNLQALPRTAMLLWGVSIVMLGVMIAGSFLPNNFVIAVSIFPLLIIMLLTENFMESQLAGSQSEAIQLTFETLLIAIFCSILIGADMVQRYVILEPELTLIFVAVFNLIVGRYAGLRLMEWIRFRTIIDQ